MRHLHLRGVSRPAMMHSSHPPGGPGTPPSLRPDLYTDHQDQWQRNQPSSDNTSQEPEVMPDFWSDPKPDTSAQQQLQQPQTPPAPGQQKTPQQQVDEYFANLQWGPEVTADHFRAEDGKPLPLNEVIRKGQEQTLRNAMGFFAESMQSMQQKFERLITEKLDSTFYERDGNAALESSIPEMNKPHLRPVLQGIYSQAMKHNKGDKAKSVQTVQAFLREFQGEVGGDSDLTTPPGQQRGQRNSGVDWNKYFGG